MHNLPPSHDNKTIEIDRTENPRSVGVKRFDILIDAKNNMIMITIIYYKANGFTAQLYAC